MQKISWPMALLALVSFSAQAQTDSAGGMNPPQTGGARAPKEQVYVSNATDSAQLAAEIPCNMVSKRPDGSWWIKGTVIVSGVTMSDTSLGGGPEDKIFESRCGKSQSK